MTDMTDNVVGAIPGLIAVGIMANVAGKVMKGSSMNVKPIKIKKAKGSNKIKNNKITW